MFKRFAAVAAAAVLLAIPATGAAAHHHVARVRLMVEFRQAASGHARDAALRGAGATLKRTIAHIDAASITVPKKGAKHAIARLRASGAVVSVQRDARFAPQESIPNDPFFPSGSSQRPPSRRGRPTGDFGHTIKQVAGAYRQPLPA